jgi:hypothetical protein
LGGRIARNSCVDIGRNREVRMDEHVEELGIDSKPQALGEGEPFRKIESVPDEIESAQSIAAKCPELTICRVVSSGAPPVLGSTAEMKQVAQTRVFLRV